MTTTLTSRPLRGPGEIVLNPTLTAGKLDGVYPFGGVVVGYVRQALLVMAGTSYAVGYESLGEIGEVLEADNRAVFTAFLRGWDDDAVRLMLAGGYELGERTGHAVFAMPGSRTPGQSASSRAVRLLYAPEDRANVPAALLYQGIPDWTEGAQVAMNRRDELGIPLSVECLRDTDNQILRVGRLDDL